MRTLELFWSFLKVGTFGWGGGPALFPLIRDECSRNAYLGGDMERLAELFAVTNALPGVTAVKMAAFIGYEEAGVLGGAAAVVGVCAPGIVFLFAFLGTLLNLRTNPDASPWVKHSVEGLLRGAQFGSVGFLLYSAYRVLPTGVAESAGTTPP